MTLDHFFHTDREPEQSSHADGVDGNLFELHADWSVHTVLVWKRTDLGGKEKNKSDI